MLFYLQFKYGKISSKHNGSVKKGVIFATYSSLIGESQSGGKYKTRFEQLIHWCGEDFDGVVSFCQSLLMALRLRVSFRCEPLSNTKVANDYLNQVPPDCLWWVSQSEKCLSNWIIQTYKNWACSLGTTEQTSQGSSCVCKCYRCVKMNKMVITSWTEYVYFKENFNHAFLIFSVPGASEPRNMAYMNRLGIWGPKTPFREFGNFIQAVERRFYFFLKKI